MSVKFAKRYTVIVLVHNEEDTVEGWFQVRKRTEQKFSYSSF